MNTVKDFTDCSIFGPVIKDLEELLDHSNGIVVAGAREYLDKQVYALNGVPKLIMVGDTWYPAFHHFDDSLNKYVELTTAELTLLTEEGSVNLYGYAKPFHLADCETDVHMYNGGVNWADCLNSKRRNDIRASIPKYEVKSEFFYGVHAAELLHNLAPTILTEWLAKPSCCDISNPVIQYLVARFLARNAETNRAILCRHTPVGVFSLPSYSSFSNVPMADLCWNFDMLHVPATMPHPDAVASPNGTYHLMKWIERTGNTTYLTSPSFSGPNPDKYDSYKRKFSTYTKQVHSQYTLKNHADFTPYPPFVKLVKGKPVEVKE